MIKAHCQFITNREAFLSTESRYLSTENIYATNMILNSGMEGLGQYLDNWGRLE